MAKIKRKFIKMRVEEESSMSRDDLTQKLDALIDSQYRKNLNKLKGSPLFLWSKQAEDCYRLRYYHSYGEDMCDTMLTVDVEKGMERCSVHGFIRKPPAIWACFWGVIASVLIDFLVISWLLLFGENFDFGNALMISGFICLIRVYLCVTLIEINRNRARALREELLNVIRDKPDAAAAAEIDDESEEDEQDEGD